MESARLDVATFDSIRHVVLYATEREGGQLLYDPGRHDLIGVQPQDTGLSDGVELVAAVTTDRRLDERTLTAMYREGYNGWGSRAWEQHELLAEYWQRRAMYREDRRPGWLWMEANQVRIGRFVDRDSAVFRSRDAAYAATLPTPMYRPSLVELRGRRQVQVLYTGPYRGRILR